MYVAKYRVYIECIYGGWFKLHIYSFIISACDCYAMLCYNAMRAIVISFLISYLFICQTTMNNLTIHNSILYSSLLQLIVIVLLKKKLFFIQIYYEIAKSTYTNTHTHRFFSPNLESSSSCKCIFFFFIIVVIVVVD